MQCATREHDLNENFKYINIKQEIFILRIARTSGYRDIC